jgi:NAD(P)-dependent dehydrogenase (short-subunit alcohol dehydrogenase family)
MTKLILITGISKGLGYAMTEGFIQKGHTVIGCARSSDASDRRLRQMYHESLYCMDLVRTSSQDPVTGLHGCM